VSSEYRLRQPLALYSVGLPSKKRQSESVCLRALIIWGDHGARWISLYDGRVNLLTSLLEQLQSYQVRQPDFRVFGKTWPQLLCPGSVDTPPPTSISESGRWCVNMNRLIVLLAYLSVGTLEAATPCTQCQTRSDLFRTCQILFTGVSGSEFGGSCSNCVAVIGTGAAGTALCSHAVSTSNHSLLFFFDDS
jgi:hypothetical protein